MADAAQVDVVVVGLGPGGEEVAGKLAEAGLDVVGVDRLLVGGECPYWGCVPSKMMLRAAGLLAEARRIPGMAGEVEVRPDWAPVAERIRQEATDTWDDTVAVERFEGKGGTFVRGTGRLAGEPGVVEVDLADGGTRRYEARRAVVMATGTEASEPPVDGLADTPHWTNRGAIETEAVPASLVVLGGGAIGCELAQVFARFGSEVTIVEAVDRLLPPEEPEASEVLREALEDEGITVRTGAAVERVQGGPGAVTLVLGDGEVTAEQLLVATGRRPTPERFEVDGRMRAGERLWAVGDVTGVGAFTHVSMYQAAIAVADVLGEDPEPADYRALPRVTFTDPEVGSVGLTEAQAREQLSSVRVGRAQVPSTARGWIHKAGNHGLIKVVEDADRGVLVGATSAGPAGGEVLGLLTLAVHAEVPVERLRSMIYAYPTFHRGVEDALRDLVEG